MTADIATLFARRMAVVEEISRLHARRLRDGQLIGSGEIELMACERDPGCTAAELSQARERFEAAKGRAVESDRVLAACEERLDEIDRLIAGEGDAPEEGIGS